MEAFQPCSDTSDLIELSLRHRIFLKPEAKLSITVALPNVRLPGKTISNWEVMERLRQMAQPGEFQVIKVSKSTLEFIRFDAEIENRSQIGSIIGRMDGKSVRLSGFPEPLKIRAAEAKPDFPTRHDWDKYFRDAKNMNEMKPGERPDTIHLQGLPSKWFVSSRDRRGEAEKPSESVLQQVFGEFGDIRCTDIPMLDSYRNKMKASISGIRTFSHETDAMFDAYIQYRDYICFVKAMDSLRGMKMVFKDGEKAFSAAIKVDFDKTKHLSDMSVRRRAVERDKLMAKERETEEVKRKEEEAVRHEMELEQRKKVEEKRLKGERRKEREEKRKQRILKKLKKREAEQMNIKIAIEERKLLMAQRKLESIRLLDELCERVKVEKQKEVTKQKEHELDSHLSKVKKKNEVKQRKKDDKELRRRDKLMLKEKQLRKKLVNKIKSAQEQQMEERREKLRKTIEGKSMRTVINKDGTEIQAQPEHYEYGTGGYDYNYEPYNHGGYGGYGEWGHRGGFRGRYFPRRPFRGPCLYRGGYHGGWWPPHVNSQWQPPPATEKKSGADDIEDVSSDSSATSKYSNLGASSDEKEKEPVKKDTWRGYEANAPPEGMTATHPWVGYSDYYNPRFMRRASRRPGGPYRGWQPHRGSFGPTPNPNVPMNSFYMQSINEQYYRYFHKLTKGEDEKLERPRSQSSDRVVCRKVLSRSRSRGRSYSKSSRSRSSRSRSKRGSRSRSGSKSGHRSRSRSKSRRRSRSRSKSRRRSHSKSKSRHRSRSRSNSRRRSHSRSKSRRQSHSKSKSRDRSHSRSKGRDRSRSKSKSEAKGRSKSRSKEEPEKNFEVNKEPKSPEKIRERPHCSEPQEIENVEKNRKEDWSGKTKAGKSNQKQKKIDESELELSLSLSGSEDWTRGSPERKAKPLGDPNWVPSDREYGRGGNYSGYDRQFPSYPFEVRSYVTRPEVPGRSREQSSRRNINNRRKSMEKESERRSRRSVSKESPDCRSRSRGLNDRREQTSNTRERQSHTISSALVTQVNSSSKNVAKSKEDRAEKEETIELKAKKKKEKKQKEKSHGSRKHKKKSSNKDSPK